MLEQQLTGNAMYEVEVKTGGMKVRSEGCMAARECLCQWDPDQIPCFDALIRGKLERPACRF